MKTEEVGMRTREEKSVDAADEVVEEQKEETAAAVEAPKYEKATAPEVVETPQPKAKVDMSADKALIEVPVLDADNVRETVNRINDASRIAVSTAQAITKKVRHARVQNITTQPVLDWEAKKVSVEVAFEKPLASEYVAAATAED